MTVGIYSLVFEGTDYLYIGQSINIEGRYKDHIDNMVQEIASAKLMAAFILFNKPRLEILRITTEDTLDEWELFYITEFNSVKYGLNSLNNVTPNNIRKGYIPYNAKYSEKQYEDILMNCIAIPILIDKNIAIKTNTDTETVTNIRKLKKHTWLKIRYPKEYLILENTYNKYLKTLVEISEIMPVEKKEKIKEVKKYPKIEAPDGTIYELKYGTISKFAKLNKLNYTGLNKVLNGHLTHISGWKLHKE